MAGYSIGFTRLVDRLFVFFARFSLSEAAIGDGREILAFMIAAALAAAIAVAVDLWLKSTRDRRHHSHRRPAGDAVKDTKTPGWSYRGRDWVIVASTVVYAFTLFAMAAYAIMAMVDERIALG